MLFGRDAELKLANAALASAHSGRASGFVVRGDPGSGRTSLVDEVRRRAITLGFATLSTIGRPMDAGIAFVGLGGLLRPLESRFGSLPGQLRTAAKVAVGTSQANAEAHQVGWATFRLLTEFADQQPLLLTIDNAQWLDEASLRALSFATSRFVAEPIAIAVTADLSWEPPQDFLTLGRSIDLGRMSITELRSVLDREGVASLPDEVIDACIRRTEANPLGMIELVRSLDPKERSGQSDLPSIPKPSAAIARGFGYRLNALDDTTRRALVVVAADDTADLGVVRSALALLGEPNAALASAEAAAIVTIERGTVRFTHELLRAVAYHQVARESRQAAHRALAAALNQPRDAVARARHLATAANGPDTDAANALEMVARQAGRRGANAEAAAAFLRSATLTPNEDTRRVRQFLAVRAWIGAGRPEAAIDLLHVYNVGETVDVAFIVLLITATAIAQGSARAAVIATTYAGETVLTATNSLTHDQAVEIRFVALALAADEFRRAGLSERRDYALNELTHAQGWPGAMRDAMRGNVTNVTNVTGLAEPTNVIRDIFDRRLMICRCEALLSQGKFADAAECSAAVAFSADPVDAYVLEIAGIRTRAVIGLDQTVLSSARTEFAMLIDAAASASPLTLESADRMLKSLSPDPPTNVTASELANPLTALTKAERRVADVVGEGRTNRETADALYLSVKTVDYHLQQIYRKLNLRSRAELAILVTRSVGAAS